MSIKALIILSIFALTSTSYAQSESAPPNKPTSCDIDMSFMAESDFSVNTDIANFAETNKAVKFEKTARVFGNKKDKNSRSIDADMLKRIGRSDIAAN